jgi:hypothetical protein
MTLRLRRIQESRTNVRLFCLVPLAQSEFESLLLNVEVIIAKVGQSFRLKTLLRITKAHPEFAFVRRLGDGPSIRKLQNCTPGTELVV